MQNLGGQTECIMGNSKIENYPCKNEEMNLKSTTSNGFNFQVINLLIMESWGGEGELDLA